MNRTKIEWTDWTWNPITGCLNRCPYCYARKLRERFNLYPDVGFSPAIHRERLSWSEIEPAKAGDKIFLGSMGDVLGPWWTHDNMEWWVAMTAIVGIIEDRRDLIFQILTKFPERYKEFRWPFNAWLGVTITGQEPADIQARYAWEIMKMKVPVRFVSWEPLLGPPILIENSPDDTTPGILRALDWQIVGPQTAPLKQPSPTWVETLVSSGVPTFMKHKLDYEPHLEQWPRDYH